MAINVSQAFKRTSIAPIDETLALTKAQMVTTVDTLMPAYYFTICQDDGKIYLYDKTATPSATTGKFKEFSGGGGGGSSDVKFFTTTDTLSKTINGTKVVAAADLPGVTWSDLVVGSSVIKDAKGTMGLVTAITGTTSVTVTTATTSTPTVELTQAQYDALATKDPDTVYFITDSQPNAGTYMGAYETIYSTTERVVGSYMGKPLYQKSGTYAISSTVSKTSITMPITLSGLDKVVKVTGSVFADGTAELALPLGSTTEGAGTITFGTVTENNVQLRIGGNQVLGANTQIRFTVQYTKTTDTTSPVEYANVNDYSTSEKIVGTWIDGRPIYQKTVALEVPANSSGGTSSASVPGLDIAVSVEGVFLANNGGAGAVDYWMSCSRYNAMFTNTANTCICWATDGSVLLRNFSTRAVAGSTAYVTARYTKSS